MRKATLTNGAPLQTKQLKSLNKSIMRNLFFKDSMINVFYQKIQERIFHPGGAGAFGYFEVTDDFSDVSKAKVFCGVGKKTPVRVRLSKSIQHKGAADTLRDARGFAVKFDTEEGILSFLAVNAPVFFFKDPVKFSTFNHAFGVNAATNAHDMNSLWDLGTSNPEALFTIMLLFSDYAFPKAYQYMSGHTVHTFQLENEKGYKHFARFHFMPDQGIANLNISQAAALAWSDPNFYTRELYNAIAAGKNPSWTLYAQVMSKKAVKAAKRRGLDVFDVTRNLYEDEFPMRKIGKLVLNRNPTNYFAEVESAAFNPANLVPGILGAPDQIFELRSIGYKIAQNYRLGVNHDKIPINAPSNTKPLTYSRGGVAPAGDNGGEAPTYYPNSFNSPGSWDDVEKTELIKITQDPNPTNQGDIKRMYEREFTAELQATGSQAIAESLATTSEDIQAKALKLFSEISDKLYNDVATKLETVKKGKACT